jgi:D-aminopeptidase
MRMVKMSMKNDIYRSFFNPGTLPRGELNSISDVDGVTAGHVTLTDGSARTGVTAILPQQGNIFREKVLGACSIINGFGKSTGLVQVDELGTIETPIILTNTLSVGDASRGLIEYALEKNEEIGRTTGTVNPLVCECNDGFLNDIRALHVKPEHVRQAIETASSDFAQGDVGAGKGMSCYKLKGGIGSSSRLVHMESETFTVGVLVLSNFGEMQDLTIDGFRAGKKIYSVAPPFEDDNPGSIIVVIATDAPLSSRQLKRLCRRASVGISRTGSYIQNGSGEIALAFSTANKIDHYSEKPTLTVTIFNDSQMDPLFRAVAEATEESIIRSLLQASPVQGRDGHYRRSLSEFMDIITGPEEPRCEERE